MLTSMNGKVLATVIFLISLGLTAFVNPKSAPSPTTGMEVIKGESSAISASETFLATALLDQREGSTPGVATNGAGATNDVLCNLLSTAINLSGALCGFETFNSGFGVCTYCASGGSGETCSQGTGCGGFEFISCAS